MNAKDIYRMLKGIKADAIGMGRHWHDADDAIMDMLMTVYYTVAELDWEEIKWLFVNYLKNGIIDFPEAKRMALKRLMGR